jgi:transmembrane sensor
MAGWEIMKQSACMTKDRLQYLLDRFLTNTATEEELQEYANWYGQQGDAGAPLYENDHSEQATEYKAGLFGSIISNIQFAEYEHQQGAAVRRMRFVKIAVAALVVVTGTLVLYYSLSTKPATTVAGNIIIPKEQVIAIRNQTGVNKTVHLQDGSEVELSAGSELRYEAPFSTKHRHVYLSGKGFFKIAKDPNRPFTVYSHDIATTALGTQFIVDGTRYVISIRLLKGKIVVNAMRDAGMALQKIYLTPGQELRINTATKHFDRIMPGSKQPQNKIIESDNGMALSFEKTSLAVAFERLSKYYKTPILYNKAEVQGLSFTGDFSPADELDLALKVICNINHLSFKKEPDRIVISKQ